MPYWQLYYHFVWATRSRLPLIDAAREEVIGRSIRATCEEQEAKVFAIGVMPDHVHLVVAVPPKVAPSHFIRQVKGSSSHLVNHVEHGTDREHFGWQSEFGVLSFGERSLPDVVAYAENQRAHHADDRLRSPFEITEKPYAPDNSERS